MLERIREGSQGPWAIGILALVILSFIFAGVGSYINSSSSVAAASVNGEEISSTELEQAYENERARMESQFGDAFATLASDTTYLQNFKKGILDRLISEKLLDQAAVDLGLRVSDAQIKEAIVGMQEFQVDGKFDNDRYLIILRQAGFQPNNFRDYMRIDMVRRQLSSSLMGSEFALKQEASNAYAIQQQTRDIKFVTVPKASFQEQVEVTPEQIDTYYQSNIDQFDTEQKVSVAYVELKLEDLMADIQVTDDELNEFYEQNLSTYRTEEERQVSHILLESAEADDVVAAQAEELLEKINTGADFAELAKEYSNDTFSAENGGDLGWFGKGIMDPAFEEAAYSLESINDVSAVIKSAFGYHIIKLTDLKPEQVTGFDEVKEDIIAVVKTTKAEDEFYEIQQRLAEVAFEVPDNLDEVAEQAGKPIVTSELFTRNEAPQSLSNPSILNSAFSVELIEDAVNSEVIEVAKNHIVILRVADYEPERTQAIEEVTEQIQQTLFDQAAQQAAKDWAVEVKDLLANNENVDSKLSELQLTWQSQESVARSDTSLSQSIVQALFAVAENQTTVVDLINGDISLVQVTKVNDAPAADDTQLATLINRLASTKAQLLFSAVIESLKADADIEIYQ
ncbi:SurA N-terminal domain-containing protein [Paraglaciecola marina]|uniref:SurA N-terminal domain-containing protein n=1 Tax=Paraglaciecola marina TaxID=2500157 RepID=UPI00105ECF75|nr:SurA N-terminal domain-containing protein [Paraglaciecola marina]